MGFLKRNDLLKHTLLCALGRPGEEVALRNLQGLRADKMDKPCVTLVSLQKCGSTLLSYCCALLNTGNSIRTFRNDFDLLPMLSFPASVIPQNFNARQDGVYQLYKINGHLQPVLGPLFDKVGMSRAIWMCREFSGYYASVYRWVTGFYARVNPKMAALGGLSWEQYKAMTLDAMARDHVDELWSAYKLSKSPERRPVLFLAYEQLTEHKEETLERLADWLKLPHDAAMLRSIAEKTSKEAMSGGDRFDPLAFGEGGGVSKVNRTTHPHRLSEEEQAVVDAIFRERFAAQGIDSYRDLSRQKPGSLLF